jgi:hypothetical protein
VSLRTGAAWRTLPRRRDGLPRRLADQSQSGTRTLKTSTALPPVMAVRVAAAAVRRGKRAPSSEGWADRAVGFRTRSTRKAQVEMAAATVAVAAATVAVAVATVVVDLQVRPSGPAAAPEQLAAASRRARHAHRPNHGGKHGRGRGRGRGHSRSRSRSHSRSRNLNRNRNRSQSAPAPARGRGRCHGGRGAPLLVGPLRCQHHRHTHHLTTWLTLLAVATGRWSAVR